MPILQIARQSMEAATAQLVSWMTALLPQVFLFLILLHALTRLIGRARVEKFAQKCSAHPVTRYLALPFLSAITLGNPMAISMGKYLPEVYKPAYFAAASYHCHTNSGIFSHVNPAELFLWLGIANGVMARGLDVSPLALRYLCAGLVANFLSGYATERISFAMEKKTPAPQNEKRSADFAPDAPLCGEAAGAAGSEKTNTAAGPGGVFVSAQNPGDRYRPITITRGDGGYGGPVTVTPTPDRHIVLCMTGGGARPEPLDRILALSGMEAVDGNRQPVPDDQVALAIIDCGGTLRCGIYPGKGIPTINLLATGKSGPLAKYMTEDLYVSAVTAAQVMPAGDPCPGPAESSAYAKENIPAEPAGAPLPAEAPPPPAKSISNPADAGAPQPSLQNLPLPTVPGMTYAAGKAVSIFHQSAREAVRVCLDTLLPFMGFAALFIGLCRGSGLTAFLAGLLRPMGGSLVGLFAIGFLCSIPGLSAVLGAGAITAQMLATLVGTLIASGSIHPALALPALFAINCQCACDFLPVGLAMMEAAPETTRTGMAAVTLSRFATGWLRILVGLLFSIGLYR